MANQISDIPDNPGTFGLNFNYAVWDAGTVVTLHNVPWNSDYRDVVKFSNGGALDSYLNGPGVLGPTFSQMSYAAVNKPIRVNLPFSQVFKYNYLRATNNAQPVPGGDVMKSYYYFITDVEYVAPNTTLVTIQLDVWQSFERDIRLGRCYVERGHIGVANENQMVNNGRDYLTVPEGLDLGGEYLVEKIGRSDVGSIDGGVASFDVIVATTISFQYSGGDKDDPVLQSATGSLFQGMPNGVEFYYFSSASDYRAFMNQISNKPWISQGIIAVYAVPNLSLTEGMIEEVSAPGIGVTTLRKLVGGRVKSDLVVLINNWREGLRGTTGRYQHLKKFLTYPYRVVEVTTYSGNPLLLKPESMYGSNVTMVEQDYVSLPGPRISFYPYRYNSGGVPEEYDGTNLVNDGAEFLDMTTGITDLPMFSVVNNGYMSFLASNKNTIAYQHKAAEWSQQRALAGNELASTLASRGITQDQIGTNIGNAANADALAITNRQAIQQRALANITGPISGLASGGPVGLAGGLGSAVAGNVGAIIDMDARNAQFANSQAAVMAQLGNRTSFAGMNRDSNKEYADFAANGDYANAIAGINARVQDAQMIQPTTSGQLGGDAFTLAVYRWAIHAKVKTIQENAMAMVGDYWLRYGYAIHRFITPPEDFRCMTNFTYWKLRETYVTSSACPESYKQAFRGIFEKGVTVWSNPANIGSIDISNNAPLEGISY